MLCPFAYFNFLQDVVLPTPSVFEENMLSTLSSFVFFNKVLAGIFFPLYNYHPQVEIVSLILEDEKFLSDLFGQLRDAKTSEDRRKELVRMMLNEVDEKSCLKN